LTSSANVVANLGTTYSQDVSIKCIIDREYLPSAVKGRFYPTNIIK